MPIIVNKWLYKAKNIRFNMINKDGTVVVGVKGKSGRKCYRDEQLRIEVIENAWRKKQKRLSDGEAIQIVLKDMTGKENLNLNVPQPILNALLNHKRNEKDNRNEGEDKDCPGGNGGIENSIDNLIPDSPGPSG
jgi:hypothetical protein